MTFYADYMALVEPAVVLQSIFHYPTKIDLKKTEVETQQGYTTLIKEMITHATLTSTISQTSDFVKHLRKEVASAEKTLKKMVSNM